MSHHSVVFQDVTVRYEAGHPPALSALSFSVEPGERVALLGLNGSGKTTLLLSAVGLLPHEGHIKIAGITLQKSTLSEVRDQVGFVFNVPEDQLLFPRVLDDVAFGLRRRGVPQKEALEGARAALDSLGIAGLAEEPVHHLSHGQKQRVALAGALVARPPVLLFDEPSSGLDPRARAELVHLLSGLSSTVLLATHDIPFASRVCQRFLILEEGHIASVETDLEEVARRWDIEDPCSEILPG